MNLALLSTDRTEVDILEQAHPKWKPEMFEVINLGRVFCAEGDCGQQTANSPAILVAVACSFFMVQWNLTMMTLENERAFGFKNHIPLKHAGVRVAR